MPRRLTVDDANETRFMVLVFSVLAVILALICSCTCIAVTMMSTLGNG